ncbi:MAG: hypothetical protein HYV52_02335 [Parcubacteria group bacterium]|nr:hypothetical protein [Parcubacteria group bacterium]
MDMMLCYEKFSLGSTNSPRSIQTRFARRLNFRLPTGDGVFGEYIIILCLVSLFLLEGCVHFPKTESVKIIFPENQIPYFDYPVYRGQNPPIKGEYFQSRNKNFAPAIIVLPILKGGEILTRHIGKTLSENNFNAFTLQWEESLLPQEMKEIKSEEDLKKAAVKIKTIAVSRIIKIRQLIDWISAKPEVDKNRLGIAGVSLGGITASLILEIDPRVKTGVVLLAGGDIGHLLAYSKEKGIIKVREKILSSLNWNQEKLKSFLNPILAPADPINYPNQASAEKILMINGLYDEVIPDHSQISLWSSLGNPEQYFILSGHYSALLWLPWADYKIVHHFQKNF